MARRSQRPHRLGRGLKRLLVPGLLGVAAYYAVFGGEYSLLELRSIRGSVVEAEASLTRLHGEIDSLGAWADSLRHDPTTIERIAREEFGMIREGETLYRFVDPDEETPQAPTPVR